MAFMVRASVAAIALALMAACGGGKETVQPKAEEEGASPAKEAPAGATIPDISADDLRRHIAILASDEFEGRAPTTPGGEKTRNYVAAEFERLGLEPIGGTYFQDVPMVEATLDPSASYLKFASPAGERTLAYKTDYVMGTKRVEESVGFDGSDIVFVGYGVVAPEHQWNDFDGVDVKGKTILILVNDPGFVTNDETLFNGQAMTYYGRWTYKFEEAARQGAAGALVIHDTGPAGYGWNVVEGSWTGPQIDLQRADDGASRAIAEGWLSNEAARALLASAGLDLDTLTAAANKRGFKAVPLDGVKATAQLTSSVRRSKDANVIGVLRGSEASDEYVLYTAHWDHLGVNQTTEGEDKIYNGAVDNATGVASIFEIAEKFATNAERPKRSVLFAAVTAEESGLLGSAYLAENPVVPLASIVAGVNIDAVLPTAAAKDLIVIGHGASELEDILAAAAATRDIRVTPDPEPEKGYFYRSDHVNFAKKGVPMLYAKSGMDLRVGGEDAGRAFSDEYRANRYHNVADEYSPDWDMTSVVDTAQLLYETGAEVAYSDKLPNWREGNEFRALRDAQRSG
ncbi:MAG: M28 family metallopeptidase, partial [Parvularculaceae bacterium]